MIFFPPDVEANMHCILTSGVLLLTLIQEFNLVPLYSIRSHIAKPSLVYLKK